MSYLLTTFCKGVLVEPEPLPRISVKVEPAVSMPLQQSQLLPGSIRLREVCSIMHLSGNSSLIPLSHHFRAI